jgi:hypothetical protein
MNYRLQDIGRPVEMADLKVGDLYVTTVDKIAVLCLRAEDDDSVFDILLASTGPMSGITTYPTWTNAGALSAGPFELITDDVLIRPRMPSSGFGLHVDRADLGQANLFIDNEQAAFLKLGYGHSPFHWFAVNLKTGKKAKLAGVLLLYADWEIVILDSHGRARILASFSSK